MWWTRCCHLTWSLHFLLPWSSTIRSLGAGKNAVCTCGQTQRLQEENLLYRKTMSYLSNSGRYSDGWSGSACSLLITGTSSCFPVEFSFSTSETECGVLVSQAKAKWSTEVLFCINHLRIWMSSLLVWNCECRRWLAGRWTRSQFLRHDTRLVFVIFKLYVP